VLENAWNQYRGWAKRAGTLKADSEAWELRAAAAMAAVFSAAAVPGLAAASKALAILVGACAAVSPVLGQDLLLAGRASGWLKARASAEEIESAGIKLSGV
jgi:hypothetical protein